MSATLSNICPDSVKKWQRSSRGTVVIRIVDKKFAPKNLTILNMFLRTRASQADCALLIITAHCMCWTRLDITLRICAYVNVTICKYAWVPMCRERGAYAFTLPCVYLSTPTRACNRFHTTKIRTCNLHVVCQKPYTNPTEDMPLCNTAWGLNRMNFTRRKLYLCRVKIYGQIQKQSIYLIFY